MKKLSILTFSVVATGLLLVTGCQETEKKEVTTTEVVKTDNTMSENMGPVDIEMSAVPETVQTSFKTKSAKAEKVTWKKYKASATEDDVRLTANGDYYYVMYYDNGADYTTWYDANGIIVKTSMRVNGPKELPDAVNMVINKEYPGYTITEIDKENDKDIDVFEIELNKGDSKSKIKITPAGEIVKRKDK